jgi:hypothetical protein
MKTKNLTFSEALDSGFPFRRSGGGMWLKCTGIRFYGYDERSVYTFDSMPVEDIIANDWEVDYKLLTVYVVVNKHGKAVSTIFSSRYDAEDFTDLNAEECRNQGYRVIKLIEEK